MFVAGCFIAAMILPQYARRRRDAYVNGCLLSRSARAIIQRESAMHVMRSASAQRARICGARARAVQQRAAGARGGACAAAVGAEGQGIRCAGAARGVARARRARGGHSVAAPQWRRWRRGEGDDNKRVREWWVVVRGGGVSIRGWAVEGYHARAAGAEDNGMAPARGDTARIAVVRQRERYEENYICEGAHICDVKEKVR